LNLASKPNEFGTKTHRIWCLSLLAPSATTEPLGPTIYIVGTHHQPLTSYSPTMPGAANPSWISQSDTGRSQAGHWKVNARAASMSSNVSNPPSIAQQTGRFRFKYTSMTCLSTDSWYQAVDAGTTQGLVYRVIAGPSRTWMTQAAVQPSIT
jgi:hypothetical protein